VRTSPQTSLWSSHCRASTDAFVDDGELEALRPFLRVAVGLLFFRVIA